MSDTFAIECAALSEALDDPRHREAVAGLLGLRADNLILSETVRELRATVAEQDNKLAAMETTIAVKNLTIKMMREALAPFCNSEAGADDWQRAAEVYAATAPAKVTVEYKGDGVAQPQYRDGAIGTHIPAEGKP